MGTRTFEGKITHMWQTFDEANRLITRQYARFNSDGSYEDVGFESFEAASGILSVRARYTQNRFTGNPTIGSTQILNYTLTQDNFIPVLSQSIVTYTQTVARAANETVTVPAGTFSSACKRTIVTNSSTTQQGVAITTRTAGPVWTNATVGTIKGQTESTASAGSFPGAAVTGTQEFESWRSLAQSKAFKNQQLSEVWRRRKN